MHHQLEQLGHLGLKIVGLRFARFRRLCLSLRYLEPFCPARRLGRGFGEESAVSQDAKKEAASVSTGREL